MDINHINYLFQKKLLQFFVMEIKTGFKMQIYFIGSFFWVETINFSEINKKRKQ